MRLQLPEHTLEAELFARYGAEEMCAIRGAGCTERPELVLMFMNPTARNVGALPAWAGLRAPWVGVGKTWLMLAQLGLLELDFAQRVAALKPALWTPELVEELYRRMAARGVFITNLAYCTQMDARPLPDAVFRAYRPLVLAQLRELGAQRVVTFGNQVSSVLLGRTVSVSAYAEAACETLVVDGETFCVYPTYYPVGQGQRNMPLAMARIRAVLREDCTAR